MVLWASCEEWLAIWHCWAENLYPAPLVGAIILNHNGVMFVIVKATLFARLNLSWTHVQLWRWLQPSKRIMSAPETDTPLVSSPETIEKVRQRFLSEPTLASQLPVTLANNFTFSRFTLSCPYCHSLASEEETKGIINTSFHDTIIIDAHGICNTCQMLFPYICRIKPRKNKFIIQTIKDGQWVDYDFNTPAWRVALYRLSLWYKKHFNKLSRWQSGHFSRSDRFRWALHWRL